MPKDVGYKTKPSKANMRRIQKARSTAVRMSKGC